MIPAKLPTADELQPHLARLELCPGSVALVAIELPTNQNFPRVTAGFFDTDERRALKQALLKCRKKRREYTK